MRRDRYRNHRRIQEAALRLVARYGVNGVSFDQVARSAQLSRGTLYNHYRSLDELIVALAEPVLSAGIAYFDARTEEIGSIDDILGVFCMMWAEYGESLRLIESVRTGELESLRVLHDQFVDHFRTAVGSLPSGALPLGHELSERIISGTFLGLLGSLENERDWTRKFLAIMKGALLLPSSKEREL